jgi:hypothetical protein
VERQGRYRLRDGDARAAVGTDSDAPRARTERHASVDFGRRRRELDSLSGPYDLRTHGHRPKRERPQEVEREVRDANVAAITERLERAAEKRRPRTAVL